MSEETRPDAFNVFQHQTAASSGSYVRATDAMANRGQVITFYHVNSGQNMAFKAFLTTYTDTFRPEWTSEAVFGRADPIYMYKNTVRSITIAFKVPAATQGEAWENLQKVQKLTTFLYPNYSGVGGSGRTAPAQTISGAPLVRMGLMNIIRTTKDDTGHLSPTDTGGIVPNTPETGLLGVIQNVTINHNLDNGSSTGGGFEQSADTDTTDEDTSADSTSILPKFIEVNLDFAVIHETHLGWFDDGTFSNDSFPYNTLSEVDALEIGAADLSDIIIGDQEELNAGETNATTEEADAQEPDPATPTSDQTAVLWGPEHSEWNNRHELMWGPGHPFFEEQGGYIYGAGQVNRREAEVRAQSDASDDELAEWMLQNAWRAL